MRDAPLSYVQLLLGVLQSPEESGREQSSLCRIAVTMSRQAAANEIQHFQMQPAKRL
jgi:hypothetical protein